MNTCPAAIPGNLLICDLDQHTDGDHYDAHTSQWWAVEDDGRHITFTIRGART